MPTTEIEFDDRNKSLYWVVHFGHLEKGVGMCHEAERSVRHIACPQRLCTHFVILSSMERSSRMKVGRVILDRSAPGRSWDMIWESTELSAVASSSCADSLPLFCSESTMVSSWSVSRGSS